eukprot:CAMPEP_0181175468 /NCGR_PEP_ID=MMETSP1096-20121128/4095_1 /TAXON_ID=156174 ORGANISM="Chrysochromulina ericina, Strain CCMP281" /NCGR_SAMPLE_ID=MMETSP1096 /ASSEMBLY_ACC=CAM_ASM_000453 /LENGTH=204 /DNA_ID=CAMNT_0023263457 /DNA_START=124 /DNA_END=738 /DNA_ORIENTATION=-
MGQAAALVTFVFVAFFVILLYKFTVIMKLFHIPEHLTVTGELKFTHNATAGGDVDLADLQGESRPAQASGAPSTGAPRSRKVNLSPEPSAMVSDRAQASTPRGWGSKESTPRGTVSQREGPSTPRGMVSQSPSGSQSHPSTMPMRRSGIEDRASDRNFFDAFKDTLFGRDGGNEIEGSGCSRPAPCRGQVGVQLTPPAFSAKPV